MSIATLYDFIVVGREKAGLTAARIVRQASWSVLIIGVQLLDGLGRTSGLTGDSEAQLEAEGVHFVRGSPQFADRRILEVDGVRYEGRHIFVASRSLQGLRLSCAEIRVVHGRVSLGPHQRNLANRCILFSEGAGAVNENFGDTMANAEGVRVAHCILGIAPPLAVT